MLKIGGAAAASALAESTGGIEWYIISTRAKANLRSNH
jgi:hypothetical protein